MGRKWNNIKEKKAGKDASRSKILAKFGKLIYAVAKKGDANPEINRELADVIARAKTYNVNRDIIDRALKKAREGGGEDFQNLRYEGYGVGGSAVIVETLTDNVNRTASEVRSTFSKNGGNLGVNGSVAFMFERKFILGFKGMKEEQVFDILLENDIEPSNIEVEDEFTYVYLEPGTNIQAQDALIKAGVEEFSVNEISMVPETYVTLGNEDLAAFEKLIDTLEDLDDVQQVFHNVENC